MSTYAAVHESIEQQVDRSPDACAVTADGASLTYRELDARANRLAHRLIAAGAARDVPIGVCLERSLDMIVTLLGILKAGAPYLPIEPSYPARRVETMREDSGCAFVVDRAWLEANREEIARCPSSRPNVSLDAHDAAYVIFTSGSTGRPKGAVLVHGALENRLRWMQATFRLGPEDAVLQKTPFTFDVSVWELFWPLLSGARLVFARPDGHRDPNYLTDVIRRERVTTLHFVPSMLGPFLEAVRSAPCPSVRRVICSGEALSPALVRAFGGALDAELHNLYGPTEATIDVSWWRCDTRAEQPTVPIGFPIANTRLYVLDAALRPVAAGVEGELYIAGIQLARGYSRRPDLTAERFVPDPFHAGERMYRSGDLARLRPDGAIEYLGRIDHQIKLRGYRIELGEIEATIAALPEVREAVVLAREDTPGDMRLVAYVIPSDPEAPPTTARVCDQVRTFLPDYMVPSAVLALEAFPLTANGKLDRAALPAPARDRAAAIAAVVRSHPGVEDVVITAREVGGGERRFVGYVVPHPHASPNVAGRPRYPLPNGMEVAQLHRHETDFMYDELFVRQAHLRYGIRLRDGATILDVGANIGMFSLFCTLACAAPRILAFEPNPTLHPLLHANLAAYAPGSRAFPCGLGRVAGEARFTSFSGYSLLSGLHTDTATEAELVKSYVLNQGRAGVDGADEFAQEAEALLRARFDAQTFDVRIRTLSDVIASERLEHIDLLKIDVEKSEVDVLAGLAPEDWRKIDQIVAEIDLAANVAPIERMLAEHGFDYEVAQDALLTETDVRHVYAVRRGSGLQLERTADEARAIAGASRVAPRFVSEARLLELCRERLPEDMVPAAFVVMDAFPRTADGAVDRTALPIPAALLADATEAPSEVETWLATTVCELLGVTELERDADMFASGGQSLLARLAVRIHHEFDVEVPLRTLFATPTVRGVAAAVTAQRAQADQLLAEIDAMSAEELESLLAEADE